MNRTTLARSFPHAIPLPPELQLLCDWSEDHGYPISGDFALREHDDVTIRCWFGSESAVGSLAQFGAGPDGSLYCIWPLADGRHPIVHMGSEGQNNFVIASNALNFLRLLAIGYDEIGFADLSAQPADDDINPVFQTWIVDTFGVTIPTVGAEVTNSAQASHPDFQTWINGQCG